MEWRTASSTFFHAQLWAAAGPRWLSGGWHSAPLSPSLLPDWVLWQTRATFLLRTQLSRGMHPVHVGLSLGALTADRVWGWGGTFCLCLSRPHLLLSALKSPPNARDPPVLRVW